MSMKTIKMLNWTMRYKCFPLIWYLSVSEAFSEYIQISKMEFFAKIVNGFQPLSVFIKISILDVWLASRNASEYSAENVAENILKKDATDTRCVNGMTLHKKWSFSLKIFFIFWTVWVSAKSKKIIPINWDHRDGWFTI